MRVTQTSHPHVWSAFQLIDADNGRPGSASWGPALSLNPSVDYDVPDDRADLVGDAERELGTLAGPVRDLDSPFTAFVIGERTGPVPTSLAAADALLNAYFEEWQT